MVDVYILHKRRKNSSKPFGFMRFKCKQGATKAIDNLNGITIRGCKIEVSIAKYGRVKMGSKTLLKQPIEVMNGSSFQKAWRNYKTYKKIQTKDNDKKSESTGSAEGFSETTGKWRIKNICGAGYNEQG